ncbi:hypothetical protein HOLleu_09012 [Holothuria leucospilota]|uniref:Uncharacterized protein n=1 Tax=Holothuria leucospilota TaxID=206669 RepID=A0A9Q1HHE6_HOLLE|nr:hypothetical protein HOLleu_09012 [Holothuria leucospilota]
MITSSSWCYKTTRQEHRIESIDERMESSREFNFNAAFLELSRSENCLRYVPIIAATWQHFEEAAIVVIQLLCVLEVSIKERSRNYWTVYTRSFC